MVGSHREQAISFTVTCVACCRSALGSKRQLARGQDPVALPGNKPRSYSSISLTKTELWCGLGKNLSSSGFDYSLIIYSVDTHKLYNKIISSCSVGHLS